MRSDLASDLPLPGGGVDFELLKTTAEIARFTLFIFGAFKKKDDPKQENYGHAELRNDIVRELKKVRSITKDEKKYVPAQLLMYCMGIVWNKGAKA